MIIRAIYNNKPFKIINEFSIKSSNNEVSFNDIKIDFTDCSIADIPFKYQEIQIKQAETEQEILNGEILFTGYLDDIDLSEMKMKKEDREMTITLLSPLKMATKRFLSLIGTYNLDTAIRIVIQPLIDDGFVLKELNVPEGQITVNYILETVEFCMNDIGFKREIFWNINERKEIFINSIDYLFSLPTKKFISQNKKEEGLLKIQPKISNVDYANIINFKNIRLFYYDNSYIDYEGNLVESDFPILNLPKTLKNGDTVQFNNPVVIDEDNLRMIDKSGYLEDITTRNALELTVKSGTVSKSYFVKINKDKTVGDYDAYMMSNEISFSDSSEEEKTIVLQRDNFFKNLITGFKWNGADGAVITEVRSVSALRYTTMKFMYSEEINKSKGVISKSGQIEKTVDYKEKWTTLPQVIDYARSLMNQNSNTVNEVSLRYDKQTELNIGDIVEINEPNFYIQGKFAVKEKNYTYISELQQTWDIVVKSSDLISTYIDMFRASESQESQSNIDTVILSEYVEEKIFEKHEIEVEQGGENEN